MKPYLQQAGIWLGAALVCIILPLMFNSGFALSMLSQMGIAVIFALSYNMLLGQGGMLSFGHAVYYGLGGFLAMHAINMIGVGFYYFRKAHRVVRRRWGEVSQMMKEDR